jgi:hypothetical protein
MSSLHFDSGPRVDVGGGRLQPKEVIRALTEGAWGRAGCGRVLMQQERSEAATPCSTVALSDLARWKRQNLATPTRPKSLEPIA